MQAAELGEFTAKIALLEEAKRKKDEEATEWQHKVSRQDHQQWPGPQVRNILTPHVVGS